jgi:hypothetical protein
MKPPVPAKGKAPAPRKEPQTRREPAGGGASAELKVVYPRRMNPQRVYALTVTATRAVKGSAEPVVLRPVIPGALVTPAEQKLDVARPGDKVTFAVTPLARGRLPGPRIEVLQDGKPPQNIPLSMKGSTQRLTRLLLLLAILVPALLWYLRAYPVQVPKSQDKAPVPIDIRRGGEEKKPDAEPKKDGEPKKEDEPKKDGEGKKDGEAEKKPDGGAGGEPKKEGGEAEKNGEQPKPPPGGPGRPPGMPPQPGVPPPPTPSTVKANLPHTPTEVVVKGVNETLTTNLPEVAGYSGPAYKAVADGLGWTYGTFIEGSDFRQLPFWSFAVLLLLSFCSWLMHGSYRGSTRKTVELTPRPADSQGIETLPLNPGDGPALGS